MKFNNNPSPYRSWDFINISEYMKMKRLLLDFVLNKSRNQQTKPELWILDAFYLILYRVSS
ncbi:MAG: hypothetical protein KAI99_09200, partial [Cyclobacteriaceae bacterium]|nr:hypothetical protein [Cyclobacteriaceae bacterium]